MSIAYSRYFKKLDELMVEANRLISAAGLPEPEPLRGRLAEVRERLLTQAPLRLVLTGEWNAGKSSLINALTGASMKIDADVCTDANVSLDWQGLTIMDTPGIQAQGSDTEHDRLAREATVGADLVLFVITNELFNPRLADYLRFILDDSGLALAGKTALIVNKIDRESNAEDTLLGEIQKVLGPHQQVPVLFCSAGKLLESKSAPPELQQRFIGQSRIAALTSAIDQFVDDAGALGRLATPLQVVAEIVDIVEASAVESPDAKNRLELIRRQKGVLQGLQKRLLDVRKGWKQQAYSTVMRQSESAVNQIGEFTDGSDLQGLFESGMNQAVADLEQLHEGIRSDIDEAIGEAQAKLDEIGASPLAKDLERSDTARGGFVGIGFKGDRPDEHNLAGKFGQAAAKPLKEGLDAAAQNAEAIRDAVYKIGKVLGKKFRPWEAVNTGQTIANVAGKLGKAVPFLAASLDFYLQYREEKVKEEKARYFAQLRQSLRNAFADQAKLEAELLEAGIVSVSKGPVADALAGLDAGAAEVAAANSTKSALASEVSALRERCTILRTGMLSGVSHQPSGV